MSQTTSSTTSQRVTTTKDGLTVPIPPEIPDWAGPGVALKALRGAARITCGASVKLWSVEGVAEDFGIDLDAATSLLTALALPLLRLPGSDRKYVNLYALESAIFAMTLPNTMIGNTAGPMDAALVRLHQELAGVMYTAGTKEAIRERVKRFGKALGRGLTSRDKKPIIRK